MRHAIKKSAVSCNNSDDLYPCKSVKQLPRCHSMCSNSASNLHVETGKSEDTEMLRCRSEGSQSSNTQLALTSMTRWIRGRTSSAPERGASDVHGNSNAPQFDDRLVYGLNQYKPAAEEIKRRWRSQQIAIQQKHIQAQRPWWSGWRQSHRCALDIAHRQK
jgi:hypothetical protein